MPPQLTAARRSYGLSALIARRAVREARKARPQGSAAVASVIAAHQIANAQTSQSAVVEMLAEQDISVVPDGLLNLPSFSTELAAIEAMLEQVDTDAAFDQFADSLVQDAARAAESVAVAVRNDIYHVRFLSPPSCSRCAVLAGRVYRWSDGFQRHPGCDCAMIPTTVASPYVQDVAALVDAGDVSGLSKADRKALADGADLMQVVNVRRKSAGLLEAGHALTRGGRPTPAGIYRIAGDRDEAVALLARYGYIT